MDERPSTRLNQADSTLLDAVKKIKDNKKSLESALANLHRHGIWAFFDILEWPGLQDATKMIRCSTQNGLGLPDRDYYRRTTATEGDPRQVSRHVASMFKLAGLQGKDAAAPPRT